MLLVSGENRLLRHHESACMLSSLSSTATTTLRSFVFIFGTRALLVNFQWIFLPFGSQLAIGIYNNVWFLRNSMASRCCCR